MSAREDIISSIRRNLATSKPFDAVHNEHGSETKIGNPIAAVSSHLDQEIDPLIDRFRESVEMLSVSFAKAVDSRDAANYIKSAIDRIGAKKIAISNSIAVAEIVESIEGVEFTGDPSREFLFDSDLGVTSAQWAIAETGTLVLEAENEDHRLISLIPPVHICLVNASRIRQTLGEILGLVRGNLGHTTTFVTGASRTSDIELTLAIGVHGPGELHVIVLADR